MNASGMPHFRAALTDDSAVRFEFRQADVKLTRMSRLFFQSCLFTVTYSGGCGRAQRIQRDVVKEHSGLSAHQKPAVKI